MNRKVQRFRLICGILAMLFVAIGGIRLAASVLPLVDPVLRSSRLNCGPPCRIDQDPVRLLGSSDAQKAAWRTAGVASQIVERTRVAKVRLMLFAAEITVALPLFFVFFGAARALRTLAQNGFNANAVTWLKRSASASIAWVLAQPVAQSIQWTALSPITHGAEAALVVVEIGDFAGAALLSASVWVCVWALEQAIQIRNDLEAFV